MLVNLRNDLGIKSKELERAMGNSKACAVGMANCVGDGHLIPQGFLGKVGNTL